MTQMDRRTLLWAAGALGAGTALPAAGRAEPVDDGTWSTHPKWPVLTKTKLSSTAQGQVSAAFAPEVLAMVGKPLTISGFLLPIETGASSRHFILSRYSPQCPFCPAGQPNEVIEVFAAKPVTINPFMAFLTGRFAVQSNPDLGLFYRMDDAAA